MVRQLTDEEAFAPGVTDLDVFRLCRCLRHAGKVMLLVVLGLVGTIYYAVVASTLVPWLRGDSTGVRAAAALGLAGYTALVGLLLWSYLAAFAEDPGGVPPGWHPFGDEEAGRVVAAPANVAAFVAQHERWARTQGGRAYLERPRYCSKCGAWKPPRAHHDSMAGRCVLKMDHYCVWVLNTVGLLNYKHFVLFLGYACAACFISAALLVRPCVDFFSAPDPPLGQLLLAFIAFVFSAAFSLALLGFVIMHLRLVALNQTTIEAYEKRPVRPWPYDRGWRSNFQEVFGRQRGLWLLPRHSRAARRAMLEAQLGPNPGFMLLTPLEISNQNGTRHDDIESEHQA